MKPTILFSLIAILLLQCKPAEKTSSTATLENTYWKLLAMNGRLVATPENGREVHIVLAKDGDKRMLKGFAGCNSIGGAYTVDGNKIGFTAISTKMFCDDRMDVENFLLDVLTKADGYKIKGETLELYQGNSLLTTFQSVYL